MEAEPTTVTNNNNNLIYCHPKYTGYIIHGGLNCAANENHSAFCWRIFYSFFKKSGFPIFQFPKTCSTSSLLYHFILYPYYESLIKATNQPILTPIREKTLLPHSV